MVDVFNLFLVRPYLLFDWDVGNILIYLTWFVLFLLSFLWFVLFDNISTSTHMNTILIFLKSCLYNLIVNGYIMSKLLHINYYYLTLRHSIVKFHPPLYF